MTGWAKALFQRDLRLSIRVGGSALVGVLFFLAVVTVVPFGVGPTSICCRASGRPFYGSARFWRRCSVLTACFRPTGTTARWTFC